MNYRTARDSDLLAIITLLQISNLPYEDCHRQLENLLILEEGHHIIALGGAQCYGDVALLRSIAIQPERRGQGLGKAMFLTLKTRVQEQGVDTLYLLTETACEYFKGLGFNQIARDLVPKAIKQTAQFSSLCPNSATVMTLNLKGA